MERRVYIFFLFQACGHGEKNRGIQNGYNSTESLTANGYLETKKDQ